MVSDIIYQKRAEGARQQALDSIVLLSKAVEQRARAEHPQLLLEIQDEWSGILQSKGDLFQVFDDRRGSDRSGLGLGLSIAREGGSSARRRDPRPRYAWCWLLFGIDGG